MKTEFVALPVICSKKPLISKLLDATKEIAAQLPMRMLGVILGIPEKDSAWLVEKGDALISNTDPEFTDFVSRQSKHRSIS